MEHWSFITISNLGYQCTNYIDDFGGVESPSKATTELCLLLPPASIQHAFFISGLLNTLRAHPSACLCPLTSEHKSDLRCWCHLLPQFFGVTLIKWTPWLNNPFFLSPDACASGAGDYFQGQFFHTPFPGHILEHYGHDINILELLAVTVALKLWALALRGQRFILNCDNKNCVLSLKSGRSRTRGMQLRLRVYHIQGTSNSVADHLSRCHLSPGHKAHFEALTADIPTVHVPCATELFNFDVRI